MIAVNCSAVAEICRVFSPEMKARNQGRILNIGSVTCFTPTELGALYEATKSFIYTLSYALQYELRPFGVGVTVSCPGSTATNFAAVSNTKETLAFKLPGMVCTPSFVAKESLRAMFDGEASVIPHALWAVSGRMCEFIPVSVVQLVANIAWMET